MVDVKSQPQAVPVPERSGVPGPGFAGEVRQSEAVLLLWVLGVDTVDTWPVDKLEKRLNMDGGVTRYLPDPEPELPAREAAILDRVRRVQAIGRVHVIPDGDAVTVLAAAPKRKVVRPTKYPKPPGWGQMSVAEQAAWMTAHPRPEPTKGKAADVIRELRAAAKTPAKGVTKEHIVGVLGGLYPDADRAKMLTNVSNLIPTRLRVWYGLVVSSRRAPDGTYYWLEPQA